LELSKRETRHGLLISQQSNIATDKCGADYSAPKELREMSFELNQEQAQATRGEA
jgi:hypothetical protein